MRRMPRGVGSSIHVAGDASQYTLTQPAASIANSVTSHLDISTKRVCVVMLTAVGDAVHVLPVANAIKRHDPRSHITWVLQPGPASLVRGHPGIDELIPFDRARGWRAFLDVRRALHEREFDVVLALQDYLKAGIVTSLTRAPVRVGYDRARARDLN